MKVICLQASPRRKGSTGTVAGWIAEELGAAGHEVEVIDMASQSVRACMACLACQQDPDQLICAVDDDGRTLIVKMAEADAIIYATPLYCWNFTGHIKPLLDRHLAFVTGFHDPTTHRSHLDGKRTGLVVTCGGPVGEGNTDLIAEEFARLMRFAKMQTVEPLMIGGLMGPGALTDEHREQARGFARRLVG